MISDQLDALYSLPKGLRMAVWRMRADVSYPRVAGRNSNAAGITQKLNVLRGQVDVKRMN